MCAKDKQKILKVAIDVPVDQLFDYLANDELIVVGQYVTVSFGRRKMVGVVCAIVSESSLPHAKLKKILSVDSEVIFDAKMLQLLNFVSNYYHFPIGQTILSVVPSRIKKNLNQLREKERLYKKTVKLSKNSIEKIPSRQLRLRRVAHALLEKNMRQTELMQLVSNWTTCIKQLEDLDYVTSVVFEPELNAKLDTPPKLNNEQKLVVEAISKHKSFNPWLIHGITGSGKTEVYMRLLDKFLLSENEQALVLVPEINLTPQLEERFRTRFPKKKLVSLHSHLTDIERLDNWRMAKSGEAKIIIGTRLSVFTPTLDLRLIIIDEEHDASFKQQDGLKYHARDVAMIRAKNAGIPIVMGTATPSLETWFNAINKPQKYKYLKLSRRAVKSSNLPDIQTLQVDMKTKNGISRKLIDSIKLRLDRKEQSLVFINRRGFSPVLICSSCSWCAECDRCSSKLVVHLRKKRLKCHHCGYDQLIMENCPDCDHEELIPLGAGTQKIEEILKAYFPKANILRVDRDTTRSKKALSDLYKKMNNRNVDILVGTQMLAKGHDFPYLTLVGILDTDNALYSSDFRASERLFSQILQVSGRAGRSNIMGEVLIQTAFPNHPIFDAIKEQDFDAFANSLLEERRDMQLPPYTFTASLNVESKNLDNSMKFVDDLKGWAKELSTTVKIFGPVRPSMQKLKGYERVRLFMQASSRKEIQIFLSVWAPKISAHSLSNRVKWSIDVDPIEF